VVKQAYINQKVNNDVNMTDKKIELLYIEDDEGLATLAKRRLERSGKFAVQTCFTGASALEHLNSQTPVAVVIDYNLPDMNGLDILKYIETNYPSIVSVMVTGAGDERIAVNAMKHHAQEYLVKDAEGEFMASLIMRIPKLVEKQGLMAKQAKADREIRTLSAVISQSSEAIIIFDDGGKVVYANAALEAVTRYTPKELIGLSPSHPDSSWPFKHKAWGMVTSGKHHEEKIIERRHDESQFSALLNISPIINADNVIEHYVVSLKDMSEFETLLAEFNQAQKMEAVGTLVGGIAHDFNNTLAGIVGNIYLARTKATALPEVVERLTSVEQLCYQAGEMIKQMLTFARKTTVEMEPLTISSFLKEVIKLHQVSLPENINLETNIEDSDMVIQGDVSQLQQVMMNFLNNARDAVENVKEPEITITLKPFTADDRFQMAHQLVQETHFACIQIADNGSGIEKQKLEHIFEPFYTTKPMGKGTGLGLAMVFGSIQSHQGFIEVESQIDEGTVFKIYLPLIVSDHSKQQIPTIKEMLATGNETILVVDDNETIRETAKLVLENLGYKVMLASDGVEAIAVYEAHQSSIDLIILDIVMPHMCGVDAAKAIHQLNPAAKIIFASGYDRGNAFRQSDDLKDAALISKPYRIDELSHTIREFLDQ